MGMMLCPQVNCHDLTGDTAGASESRIESLFLTGKVAVMALPKGNDVVSHNE